MVVALLGQTVPAVSLICSRFGTRYPYRNHLQPQFRKNLWGLAQPGLNFVALGLCLPVPLAVLALILATSASETM